MVCAFDELDDDEELPDSEFLKDLADKLRQVPTVYGVDDYHIDRLENLAHKLEGSDA